MRHPTEEEIQAYLDGVREEGDAELERHLETCSQCREALAIYRTLYRGLGEDAGLEVPRGLTRSVLLGLGLKQPGWGSRIPGDLVLVASAVAAMLVGIVVFTDFTPLLSGVSAVFGPILDYASSHIESAHALLEGTRQTRTIVGAGVFILAFTALLDLVCRRGRLRATSRQMY